MELIMNSIWNTSVNDLLAIFRGALVSVIPWIEKAKIKWKTGEAYDDWDRIAKSLFDSIVCSPLTGTASSKYTIASYDFYYENYSLMDFILVKNKSDEGKNYAFISFQSTDSLLDSVSVAELNESDKVVKHLNLNLDEVIFFFAKNKDGEKEILEKIVVSL
jgi:hypothetical protein